jgi:hypothetical protein
MGKVAILAFGFGGGVAALVNMALAYQLDLEVLPDIVLPTATAEQMLKAEKMWRRAFLIGEDFDLDKRVYMACDVLKQAFRTANSAIDQLRKDIDTAVKAAVAARDGSIYNVGRCKVFANNSFLVIELPSGRRLLYASPQLKTEEIKDPDGGKPWVSTYITYSTSRGRGWMRERAWCRRLPTTSCVPRWPGSMPTRLLCLPSPRTWRRCRRTRARRSACTSTTRSAWTSLGAATRGNDSSRS